jgi:hypothetical protein
MNLRRLLKLDRLAIFALLIGFIGGFLWLTGIRYFIAQPKETHYHSNFAVYINGVREEFKDFTYYEEVAACTSSYEDNPKGRVHMHNNVNDVIHVHDKRVTYGNFFQNIGWNIGSKYLATKDAIYQNAEEKKVTFILNGEEIDSITNRVIGNVDKLLINYGAESDQELQTKFTAVTDTAAETNKYQDPSSCGGLNGAGHDSFISKLKRATFWP